MKTVFSYRTGVFCLFLSLFQNSHSIDSRKDFILKFANGQSCDFVDETEQIAKQYCQTANGNIVSPLLPMLATARAVVLQCNRLQNAICHRSQVVKLTFRHLKKWGMTCIGRKLFEKLNSEVQFHQHYCRWL